MQKTFKVTNPNDKMWNDKRFVEATLQELVNGEPEGEKYQISFWNGEITMEGGLFRSIIDGELSKNDKGYWKLSTPKQVAGGNFKTMQTEKLMDKKADNIAVAQNNKENGIRIASTMSGAVALAVAQFKSEPNDLRTLEELVEYYRRFLWLEWENVNHLPPFK